MSVNAISGVNSYSAMAISAISSCTSGLKPETIKKLKALGIDPSTVKTESEAQSRIAQAEKQKQNTQSVQPQQSSSNVDMKQLQDDIKTLGDKLGIDTTTIKDLDKERFLR